MKVTEKVTEKVSELGSPLGRVSELGEYLREQRHSAQLSLRQLAEVAGVSNPYLSQVERGLRKPSAEVLQQIAKGLRISAEVLYVRAGILDERDDRMEVEAAVMADPHLTERQRQVLLDIYTTFRTQDERTQDGRAGDAEGAGLVAAGGAPTDGGAAADGGAATGAGADAGAPAADGGPTADGGDAPDAAAPAPARTRRTPRPATVATRSAGRTVAAARKAAPARAASTKRAVPAKRAVPTKRAVPKAGAPTHVPEAGTPPDGRR